MTESLGEVAAAALAFVGSHLGMSSPPLRARLVGWIGERGFRGLYSAVAIGLLVWLVAAFNAAPIETVWLPPTALRHLSLTIMTFACILFVAGVLSANPTAIGTDSLQVAEAGPVGIFKITRHPVMWSFALWGISHLLANGDAAGMILFGAIAALALIGALHIDARKRRELGAAWVSYAAATSFVPFEAAVAGRTKLSWSDVGWRPLALGLFLYAVLLLGHEWAFGVNPMWVG